MKKKIESYQIKESGYHPFLIRDGWQVAQLNYAPEQHIEAITKIDVHHNTDEVFVLLKGCAVLIAASLLDNKVSYQLELMQPNKVYNIPKGTWHNIAMEEESELLIIEKSNTHISDFEYFHLDDLQCQELHREVKKLLTLKSN